MATNHRRSIAPSRYSRGYVPRSELVAAMEYSLDGLTAYFQTGRHETTELRSVDSPGAVAMPSLLTRDYHYRGSAGHDRTLQIASRAIQVDYLPGRGGNQAHAARQHIDALGIPQGRIFQT